MSDRLGVIWLGDPLVPDIERELRQRNLFVLSTGNTATPEQLCRSRAAVFNIAPGNLERLAGVFRSSESEYLDHGLAVFLVTRSDATTGRLQSELGGPLDSRVHIRTAPPAYEIPEAIARHNPGPGAKLDLEITLAQNIEPLRARDWVLFQRAFHNCKSIALSELGGGRSEARVFSAHATLFHSIGGLWPQPFFVKLDQLHKVKLEEFNYSEYALPFIPFGLRPNIRSVISGSDRGILVGDFVDRSESLWDLARRNVARSAVSSLIDVTLGGWRDQAYAREPVTRSVASAIEGFFCEPEKLKGSYLEYGRAQGVTKTPRAVWEDLKRLRQTYREAPMHGDLHGENVRVRDGNAILIDLASVMPGPLTIDLANLETWVAFELPPDEKTAGYENAEWRDLIDELYDPTAFQHPPKPGDQTARYCWLTAFVRQVRHLGLGVQTCPSEYQSAVAACLLRRCMWNDGLPGDRFRRGHGFVVAARLAEDLSRREPQ